MVRGVALGVGDVEGGVGEELGVPAGLVEEVVVAAAEQDEVREGGGAAVFPEAEVVAFAPAGGAVAAREPAMFIAYDQGVEQRSGDGAGGPAVVEDGGPPGGEDPVQGTVAQQPLHRGPVEGGAVGAGGADAAQGEVALDVEDDVEVGAVAATGVDVLVIEKEAADVPQGVGPPCGGLRTVSASLSGVWARRRAVESSSPVSARRLASRRHRPARVGDRCRAWGGSGLGSRSAVAASRQARMAVPTSRAGRSTSVGTMSLSWSAKSSAVSASRLAAMASTWPLDKTPARHEWRVTASWASLRAREAVAAACGRAMRARSASHAVIDVAPSSSHSDARSTVATASVMRASSRSRRAMTVTRASPSTGMSKSSMARSSCPNTPPSYTSSHHHIHENLGKPGPLRP